MKNGTEKSFLYAPEYMVPIFGNTDKPQPKQLLYNLEGEERTKFEKEGPFAAPNEFLSVSNQKLFSLNLRRADDSDTIGFKDFRVDLISKNTDIRSIKVVDLGTEVTYTIKE